MHRLLVERRPHGGLDPLLRLLWREVIVRGLCHQETAVAKGIRTHSLRKDQAFDHSIPPHHFDRIGRVIAAWSSLEFALDDLLWHFLDISDEDGRALTSKMDAQRKIGLLRIYGKSHLSKDRWAEFSSLLTVIDDLKEDRNFIVHGFWGCVTPERIPAATSLRPKADPDRAIMETFPPIRMTSISDGVDYAREQIVSLTLRLSPSRKRLEKPRLS